MRSLGRPNREQVVTTRPDDLTTLQALDLTNGQVRRHARPRGDEHLQGTVRIGRRTQLIDWLYLSALCREPTAAERVARQLVGETSPPTSGSRTCSGRCSCCPSSS